MIKRIIFFILCLFIILFGVYRVYDNYRTQQISSSPISSIKYDVSEAINVSDLNTQLISLKDGENLYALFFDPNDINSQYMFNVTLSSIISDRDIKKIDNLIFVDITGLSKEAKTNLRARYGFTSVPALCSLSFSEGSVIINNVIQEDSTNLLNQKEVEDWLVSNKLLEAKED